MLRILLVVSLLASSVLTFAQRQIPQPSPAAKTATAADITAQAPKLNASTDSRSVVIDTIFPSALLEDCAQPVLFITGANGEGFVTGTNQFFDFEKLQRITLEEAVDVTVNQAVVGFAVAEDSIDNRDLVVKVYMDLGGSEPLGELVGISDTLKVSEITANDTALVFTTFNFSEPAVMEGVSSFLLSVDISGVYFDETDTFDPKGNVGIFSTPDGCGDGTNLFEIFPTADGGLGFSNIFVNWQGLNTEMYVGAIIDRGTFTSTRTPNVDYGVEVFPNPVAQDLNLTFNAPTAGVYTTRVVSTIGSVIRSQVVQTVAGATQVALPVADLPAGIYLFQVEGSNGVQTGKFVKQ